MNHSTPGLPVHHQLPEFTQTHIHRVSDAIQPSHPLLSPSPPAPNPSQHQSLFQWVNSWHEVAKVLEFQLQHQSFQRNARADLLQNALVGSPCSPRDSQESSSTPQFKSINSSKMLKKTSKIFLLVSDLNTVTNAGSQAAITQIRRARLWFLQPALVWISENSDIAPQPPECEKPPPSPLHMGFHLHAFHHRQGEQMLAPRRMDISPHYASVYWPTQVSSPYYSAPETDHSESTKDSLTSRCEVHSSWKRL